MDTGTGNDVIRIGDWTFRANVYHLERRGKVVKLEPRVADLLLYLATNAGSPVSRNELMENIWPDMVVGDEALTNAINKLRKAFGDDYHSPRFIETIPKMGYRLIATVRQESPEKRLTEKKVANGYGNQEKNDVNEDNLSLAKLRLLIWVGLVIAAIGITAVWMNSQNSQTFIPSIAVLPFENLSRDSEQEHLADGITEDIITDLSRLSNLLVVSSSASNRYKDQDIQLQEVAADLKVEFILQGSVRWNGDDLRVNAQLVDAKTGFNKWAQRYDRNIGDLFAIQNEVTNSIVEAFGLELTAKERQGLAHITTNNLKAYDFFQEGQKASRIQTKEASERAQLLYRKAIEADPNYGRAYGALAYSLAFAFRRGWTQAPVETLTRALELAKTGVQLDGAVPQTHWSLGYVYMMRQEFQHAETAVLNAVKVSPSYADGYGLLALISNNLGQSQKAISYVQKGMRLNPFYTWDYLYNLGRAYYTLGQYEEAIGVLEQARDRNENALPVKLFLAASYIKNGQQEDAEWEAEQIQMLSPTETISHTKQTIPVIDKNLMESFLEDLRKAGIPE